MSDYRVPMADMRFLLFEVFQADKILGNMEETNGVSADLINAILEEAGKIAEGLLAPINRRGDLSGCHWQNGEVTTPEGFREAYKAYAEGGWSGLTGNTDFGGQGMPKLLSAQIEEMLLAANCSFALYTILTTGATLTINEHASKVLKARYLPKMYAGDWTGTMCLTESHAGTDLGMIRTRAVPQGDGSYSITGTKIFITAGEHDLTENIIHLVLAKIPDAPPGPKGISLFLVPKFVVTDNSELTGARNNVTCGSIERKMGIKASSTCVMNFDGAKGWLVGEKNNGLSNMFTMMNYERLSMGLQANGLAESSYQTAAEYARERVQGRAPGGAATPDKTADPILVHPDVRRMLLTMRANIMAGRALSMYAALQLDIARFNADASARHKAQQLVALLIPVQKAYCTDRGFEACVLGQQVLGGHGYVAEWGLEQNVRDVRIAQIYEGANGIQALDLMGRKTVRGGGKLLQVLVAEMDEFCSQHQDYASMVPYLPYLEQCKQRLIRTTERVIQQAEINADEIGAASYPYMELLGLSLYCFMWQRMLAAALHQQEIGTGNAAHLSGIIKTGNYFFTRLLPRTDSLAAEIAAGSDSLMALAEEEF
ncbi:MAG: acyl-CoA dehydrogenase C-terminal domain-containing protein [Gammaproteobacteria bacterium]|nr:acyl-CoA dehydrogenase C-terminal domain-containing protein [Gammaproteobacteria bacterium]